MKKIGAFSAMILVLTFLCTTGSFARNGPGYKWQGSGGWGMGSPYQRMWDRSKIETVKGTVDAVETIAPMEGMQNAVVIVLSTPKETIPVHLGPQWYIERLDLEIRKGDIITVRGSRTTCEGKPIIIAGGIEKGDQGVILRSDTGVPAWAGWR